MKAACNIRLSVYHQQQKNSIQGIRFAAFAQFIDMICKSKVTAQRNTKKIYTLKCR